MKDTLSISRRSLLRGLGASIALPLLESIAPAAYANTLENKPKRLSVFYTPNGMSMDSFTPLTTGMNYAMTPILEPLAAYRNQFSVISGLAHYNASALGDGPGSHGRSCGAYLTGAHPKRTEGSDLQCGISMDQVVANHFATETQLASLELGIEPSSLLGSCDIGYSCTYTNTLSWRSPTVALPVTVNPRDVFERLFGDGMSLDEESRQAQFKRKSSILDFVRDDAARLTKKMGMNDRRKMDEYLASIRDIERRIQKASSQKIDTNAGDLIMPTGIPNSFEDHVKIMIDLQVLALQTDMTRVCTFMLGRELSNRTYPDIGVPDSHHSLSHHGGNPEKIAKLVKINRHHMEQFAYCLERMSSTKDGESSLLDSTLLMAGASLGEPNAHDNMNLPAIIAGGGLQGNRHIAVEKNTPMCNLMLSMINKLGVPAESFGDSTGLLHELSA
ncbi:DUF1552 domain-containing protein [Thalassolituus oleivorans]|uniref:DUF1552 domain-containing protein n=1 Tax=Thalassolituus oleivorans TaxID=187493 RepID=UPI001CE3003B|nr:DUF1552 domain-containing protein [Thalassolituus oleivorans]